MLPSLEGISIAEFFELKKLQIPDLLKDLSQNTCKLGLTLWEIISSFCETNSKRIFKSFKDIKIHLINIIYYLIREKNTSFKISMILINLREVFNPDLTNEIKNLFLEIFTFKSPTIKTDSIEPESYFKDASDYFLKLLDGKNSGDFMGYVSHVISNLSIYTVIANMFTGINKPESFNDFIFKVHQLVTKKIKGQSLKDILKPILEVINWLIDNTPKIISGEFDSIDFRIDSDELITQLEDWNIEFSAWHNTPVEYESKFDLSPIELAISLKDKLEALKATVIKEISKGDENRQIQMQRYVKELRMQMNILSDYINKDIHKVQPMGVIIQGQAGSGKTRVASDIADLMQIIGCGRTNSNHVAPYDAAPEAKFQNSIMTSTEVIKIDDLANDQSKRIHSDVFIKTTNIERLEVPKAGVEDKAAHFYNNVGTVITTNDANFGLLSTGTISIDSAIRRFPNLIKMDVNKEYLNEHGMINYDHPAFAQGEIDDFNTICFYRNVHMAIEYHLDEDGNETDQIKRTYLARDEIPRHEWIKYSERGDAFNAIQYLKAQMSKQWNKNKKSFEDSKAVEVCPKCQLRSTLCACCQYEDSDSDDESIDITPEGKFETFKNNLQYISEQGFKAYEKRKAIIADYNPKEILETFKDYDYSFITNRPISIIEKFNIMIEEKDVTICKSLINQISYYETFKYLYNRLKWHYDNYKTYICLFSILFALIATYVGSGITYVMILFNMFLTYINHSKIENKIFKMTEIFTYLLVLISLKEIRGISLFLVIILITFIHYEFHQFLIQSTEIYNSNKNYYLSDIARKNRIKYIKRTMILTSLVGIISFLYKITKSKFIQNLKPELLDIDLGVTDANDAIKVKSSQKNETDEKYGAYHINPVCSHEGSSSTVDQFDNKVVKSQYLIKVYVNDNLYSQVVASAIGNVLMVVDHAIPREERFTVKIGNRSKVMGLTFEGLTRDLDYVQLKNSNGDFVDQGLLYVATPRSTKLINHFLVNDLGKTVSARFCKNNFDESKLSKFSMSCKEISNEKKSYKMGDVTYMNQPFYEYKMSDYQSTPGDCGSLILARDTPTILGVHVAGQKYGSLFSKKISYFLPITSDMINEGANQFRSQGRMVLPGFDKLEMVHNERKLKIIETPITTNYFSEFTEREMVPCVQIGVLTDENKIPYAPRAEEYYFKNRNPGVPEAFGESKFAAPKQLNSKEYINNGAGHKLSDPAKPMPADLLQRAADDYLHGNTYHKNSPLDAIPESCFVNSISQSRKRRGLAGCAATLSAIGIVLDKVDLSTALDGDESGIIKGIPNGTSAGLSFRGKKSNYMVKDPITGNPLCPRQLINEAQEAVDIMTKHWETGYGTLNPFVRNSKSNEILPWDKVNIDKKCRSFYANSQDFFIASMQFFVPAKHILRVDPMASECFVGINLASAQAKDFKDYITNNGEFDRFVCGDFSGFDTRLGMQLHTQALNVLYETYKLNGASESTLTALESISASIASPTIVWDGALLSFANSQPSGQPMTVEVNGIDNSLLLRCAFYGLALEHDPAKYHEDFRKYVRAATYGDDNAMGVSKFVPWFNHTNIMNYLARFGIKYTMADKKAESRGYIPWSEVSFLKQTIIDHPVLGTIGQLEWDSVIKSFYFWTKRKNSGLPSFAAEFSAKCESALRSAALYGEDKFNEFVRGLEHIVEQSQTQNEEFHLELGDIPYLTYDDLMSEKQDYNYRQSLQCGLPDALFSKLCPKAKEAKSYLYARLKRTQAQH